MSEQLQELPHLQEARQAVEATRGVVKASMRSLRTTLQFLADLDERLTVLDAQPEEAQRHGSNGRKDEDTT